MESRRGRHAHLSSLISSEFQQSAAGVGGARMASADTEMTSVSGAGFGWGSSKGQSLSSSRRADSEDSDVLDRDRGAGARGEPEGGSFGAGRLAIKAAMRFKGRTRKGGGGASRGGGGEGEGCCEVMEVLSLASYAGTPRLDRRLAAGSEVTSKGEQLGGMSSDDFGRRPSSGYSSRNLMDHHRDQVWCTCAVPPSESSFGPCTAAGLWGCAVAGKTADSCSLPALTGCGIDPPCSA